MVQKQKRRLGEILIEDGALTREHLEEALNYQKSHGGLIGQILISLGYLTEEDVVSALTKQLDIPYLPLTNYSVNLEAARILDEEFCRRNMFAIFDQGDDCLFVSLADPLNDSVLEEINKRTQLKLQVFISTTSEIMNILDLVFNHSSSGPQPTSGS